MTRLLPGRVVLFDCDGVLVDSDAAVITAWERWAIEHGLSAAAVLAVVHGRRSKDTVTAFLPEPERAAALAQIDRYEVDAALGVEALPGARELLASMPPSAWAVVTSGRRELALARIAAAGLPLPAVLITADDVRRGKPEPEGYLAAAGRLGAPAGAAVVVEDTAAGIKAARAAGASAVLGVGPRSVEAAPDAVVADLRAVSWHEDGLAIDVA